MKKVCQKCGGQSPSLLGGVRGGLEYNKTFYLAKDPL